MALKWGLVGCGQISEDFAKAMSTLITNKVVAVAARSGEKAREFGAKLGVQNCYEGYLKLAQDKNVDVVYVGVVNPQHLGVAKLMLENGKHVLCEKPMGMNCREVEKLIQLAKVKRVFLMEAIWSRFFPAYQYLTKSINSGKLGSIKSVFVGFGFDMTSRNRIVKKELGGGVILDIGVYAIQMVQLVLNDMPKSITASGKVNQEGVDIEVEAQLDYPDGKTATIKLSALKELINKAIIIGTKGQITVNDFWCPTSLTDVDGTTKEFPLPASDLEFNHKNSLGMIYQIEEVSKYILSGKLECPYVSHKESVRIATLQDEIRSQIGVVYDADIV